MKRLFLIICFLLFSQSAWAAWTIDAAKVSRYKNYLYWSATLTSDGNALTATNLLAESGLSGLLSSIRGSSLMVCYVLPGTGAVIPNTTINITITNEFDAELWSDTGMSQNAGTWHKLYEDLGPYPPIVSELNIALNDIGDAGDQVTVYFLCWVE